MNITESITTPSFFDIIKGHPSLFDNSNTNAQKEESSFEMCYHGICFESYDQLCSYTSHHGVLYQVSDAYEHTNWFLILVTMSALLNATFVCVVWSIQEINVHPMKILMNVAFWEAVFLINVLMSYQYCDLDLPRLLSYSLFFNDDQVNLDFALILLSYGTIILSQISLTISVFLNIALSLDLIKMISRPFDSNEARVNKYLFWSYTIAITLSVLQTFFTEIYLQIFAFLFARALFAAYIIVSVVSVIYAWIKLSKPGVQSKIRHQILRRHIFSQLFYFLAMIYVELCEFWGTSGYRKQSHNHLNIWWINSLKIFFCFQGFFLPLVRLSEPYFYKQIRIKIRKLIRKAKLKELYQTLEDATFLYRDLAPQFLTGEDPKNAK